MSKFITAAKKFVVADEGAALVEYGLLVGLIAVICVASIQLLGNTISGYFANIAAAL